MKKLLRVVIAFCFLLGQPLPVLSALNAAIEWDIQSTGVATNGCGFKAGSGGTDRSQVGATPYLSLTSGGTNNSTASITTNVITFTGSTYTVIAGDVGNIVWMASGTNVTAGFYEITSVGTGLNGTWTMDRNVVTSGTTTDAVGYMGGSCDEPNTVMANTSIVAGNTIHVKNATYSRTTTINLGASGTNAAGPIKVIGYNSTHNDITTWSGMTNAPTFTSNTNSIVLVTTNGKDRWSFKSIKFTHTAATRGKGFSQTSGSTYLDFDLTSFDGLSNAIDMTNNINNYLILTRSEVKNSTGAGIVTGNSRNVITNSWISRNTTRGFYSSAGGELYFFNSVFDHNGTAGIETESGSSVHIVNSVVSCNVGTSAACGTSGNNDGIVFATAAPIKYQIINSILWGNGRYNLSLAGVGGGITVLNSAFGGAGTSNINGSATTGTGAITLTADPFVNSAAGGDFSLNATTGGGVLLKGLGYPGAFPGGTMTGYSDVGPLQHRDAGSIGGVF